MLLVAHMFIYLEYESTRTRLNGMVNILPTFSIQPIDKAILKLVKLELKTSIFFLLIFLDGFILGVEVY